MFKQSYRQLAISACLCSLSLFLTACSSNDTYTKIEPADAYITVNPYSSIDTITEQLYSPILIEHALNSNDNTSINIDDNTDVISKSTIDWINNLDESKDVKNLLFRFANSVQEAISIENDQPNNIKGPIMYNLVQTGYDLILYKGIADGKKLLDEVANHICDTRAKTIKYMHFLQEFEPAKTNITSI